MSARSRVLLSTSWPIVCNRVSSSTAISDFPTPSAVPGCSTSTVAVERYMSGSEIAKVVALASTAAKTTVASRVCRRKSASAPVIVKPPSFTEPATIVSPCSTAISGHEQSVAGLEKEALRVDLGGDDLVVVAGDSLDGRAFHAEDHHLRPSGIGAEAPGEGDGFEDGSAALEVVAAGLVHLADHRHLEAVDLADDDRHLG